MKKLAFTGGWFRLRSFAPSGVRETFWFPNGLTTIGLNRMLDVMFHGTAQISTWNAGLISNAGFSAVSAADTMASHPGWVEEVNYTEGTRPEWVEGAASGGAITNPTPMVFSLNATVALRGAFITSNDVKGGTTGVLWCTGLFSGVRSYVSGTSFELTYQDLHG